MGVRHIYKIVEEAEWRMAAAAGVYEGSADDRRDGFIHFSTAGQVEETAAGHFAGRTGLILVEVAANALGPARKWEASRGGELFPHLYGPLATSAETRRWPIEPGPDGRHRLPEGIG